MALGASTALADRALFALGRRIVETIAKAAHRLDEIYVELLAQPADKHFDRVGVAVEVLIVEMFDEFGARYDLALVMGEIGEQPVFQAGQLHRIAVDGHSAGP